MRAAILQVLRPKLTVPQGLIGYWPLRLGDLSWGGNLAYDRSGGNITGTLTNFTSAALTSGNGTLRRGLAFDGTSQHIDISSLPTQTDVSFTMWVRPAVAGAGQDDQNILTIGTTSSAFTYYICVGGGIPRFYDNENASFMVPATATTPVGIWTHLAFVAAISATTMYTYVNGLLAVSRAIASSPPWGTTKWLGRRIDQYNENASRFSGGMTDVRVYRRGLRAQEVRSIYEAERSGRA